MGNKARKVWKAGEKDWAKRGEPKEVLVKKLCEVEEKGGEKKTQRAEEVRKECDGGPSEGDKARRGERKGEGRR